MFVRARLLAVVKFAIALTPFILAACKGGTSGY
jgi:hypothetical protein